MAKQPQSETTKPTTRTKRARSTAVATVPPSVGSVAIALDPEQRRAMIAEAAYFRAERRGFAPGYEIEDWLACEQELDARALEKPTSGHDIH